MKVQKKHIISFFYGIYTFLRVLWSSIGGPGHVCPFYPTCGSYIRTSFSTLPFHRACIVSIQRVLSCHPWQKGRIDHPPTK